MADPIIVKTVENSFIPLLIHNNSGGVDAQILRKYKEPAWNYQVVRFLSGEGKDIIPRRDRVNTRAALAKRMIQALEKAKQPVPEDLKKIAK